MGLTMGSKCLMAQATCVEALITWGTFWTTLAILDAILATFTPTITAFATIAGTAPPCCCRTRNILPRRFNLYLRFIVLLVVQPSDAMGMSGRRDVYRRRHTWVFRLEGRWFESGRVLMRADADR